MTNNNGRPVFEMLAFKDQHQRTEKTLEFFNRQQLTDGGDLVSVNLETKLVRDISVEVDSKLVPNMLYPVFLNKEAGVLIDGRSFRGNDNSIRNSDSIGNLSIEATLEYYWCTDLHRFSNVANTTSAIYGTWIATAFKDRLGGDFRQQAILRSVFAFYYWLRFKGEDDLYHISRDDLEVGFYNICVGQFKLPKEIVDDIISSSGMINVIDYIIDNQKEYMHDLLPYFCGQVPNFLSIPNVKTFDYNALMNIVSGKTWVGASSMSYTLGALEHPPTLMTMIAISEIKKTFYQKSYIGRVVKNLKVMRISGGEITRVVTDSLIDIQE